MRVKWDRWWLKLSWLKVMMGCIQLWFPISSSQISSGLMETSTYILPHQLGTTAMVTPTIYGIDQLKLLLKLFKSKNPPKVVDTKIFFNAPEGKITTLISLRDKFTSKRPNEQCEFIQQAVRSAVKELNGVNHAEINASTDPHTAGKYPHWIVI